MRNRLNIIYTKEDITQQLKGMNAPRDSVVLMHSSLRLIGQVHGGAEALLDALIDYFTADRGLLCIPTHTWRNLLEHEGFALDLTDSTTCLGAFSDLAARDPRGIRSQNPTHSMAIFGDRARAAELMRDEPSIRSGTAPESCYGKICEWGGKILLVGVSHNRNTYLHCVEEMLNTPDRLSPQPKDARVRHADGTVTVQPLHTHRTSFTKDVSARFHKYETAFRYHGAITDGFIGNAPAQLCDARIMRDVMALIMERSGGVDPLESEAALSPKLYY
jgi:aminoglycoside 3-N-acetyltransferase